MWKVVLNCLSFGVVIALFSMALDFYICPTYTVHQNGIVVVTGASSGIGRHAAEELARIGYHVFAGVRNSKDSDDIFKLNIPTLQPLMLDVTMHNSCASALEFIEAYQQSSNIPLVAIVNNAGIAKLQPAEYFDLDDGRQLFETNFFGMIRWTQLTLPLLRKSKGRVIMISSITGFFSIPLYSMYAASKFAMEGFADSLRREVQEFGIAVSVVQPGSVTSSIRQKVSFDNQDNLFSLTGLRKDIIVNETVNEVLDHYSHLIGPGTKEKLRKRLQYTMPPNITTSAIVDSITNPKPKTRYVVANAGAISGWLMRLIVWILPDRVEDRLCSKFN